MRCTSCCCTRRPRPGLLPRPGTKRRSSSPSRPDCRQLARRRSPKCAPSWSVGSGTVGARGGAQRGTSGARLRSTGGATFAVSQDVLRTCRRSVHSPAVPARPRTIQNRRDVLADVRALLALKPAAPLDAIVRDLPWSRRAVQEALRVNGTSFSKEKRAVQLDRAARVLLEQGGRGQRISLLNAAASLGVGALVTSAASSASATASRLDACGAWAAPCASFTAPSSGPLLTRAASPLPMRDVVGDASRRKEGALRSATRAPSTHRGRRRGYGRSEGARAVTSA